MQVIETNNSRAATDAFEGSSGTLNYVIQIDAINSSEDETAAMDFVKSESPTTFTAATGTEYNRQSITLSPDDAGCGILRFEVKYSQVRPRQFSFQTGGGSEKIEYSRSTEHWYSRPEGTETGEDQRDLADTPDFHSAINVTKSSIEGISIKTAQFGFKITKSWAPEDIDGIYLRSLEWLTTTVNNTPTTFSIDGIDMEFLAGELLFEGADGQRASDGRYELTYSFAVSRNITPGDPDSWRNAGPLTITEKDGWDLIWIYSEETTDSATHTLVRTPIAAYVERVYKRTDFSDLELDA